jgi:hypothetical protein
MHVGDAKQGSADAVFMDGRDKPDHDDLRDGRVGLTGLWPVDLDAQNVAGGAPVRVVRGSKQ